MGNHDLVVPDFDDMVEVAKNIKNLIINRDRLEVQIKQYESEVYKKTATDSAYYIGGKPPSASFVKAAFEYTGLNNEILPLREAYAVACAELEFNRILFETMKMQVDLYRTESANKRYTSL